MPDIKEVLISPFTLVPSDPSDPSNPSNPSNPSKKAKAHQRPFQPCKCDSDNEDNDFGMAPECAFVCSMAHAHASRNKTTKKRKQSPRKKTRKNRHQ